MHYYSTRGQDGPLGYEDTLLSGLARDGGLYLPETWPKFSHDDIAAMQGLSYAELAGRIMAPFCVGEVDEAELTAMARDAYADFDHPDIAPLATLQDNLHVLELFHGPAILGRRRLRPLKAVTRLMFLFCFQKAGCHQSSNVK
jgi:threonine synthase